MTEDDTSLSHALPFRLAVVCASNMNRSMDAHNVLMHAGYEVDSYGTSSQVKLPGPSRDRPNVYAFGTPYAHIQEQLRAQNEALYTRNGVLAILERNKNIKKAPERWQDEVSKRYDLVITYEERVFDALVDDLNTRESDDYEAVHVLNMTVVDNHEQAAVGAKHTLTLIRMLQESGEDWKDSIDEVLERFKSETDREVLQMVVFY